MWPVRSPGVRAQRQVARHRGLARAREAGKVGGRRPKITPEDDAVIRARKDAGTGVGELARDYEVDRRAIYRSLRRTEKPEGLRAPWACLVTGRSEALSCSGAWWGCRQLGSHPR
jgi:DNA invertase Pin-like site-specific DNA recombinase